LEVEKSTDKGSMRREKNNRNRKSLVKYIVGSVADYLCNNSVLAE